MFLVLAMMAILITNVFASQNDPRKPLSMDDMGNRSYKADSRFTPTFSFAINPVTIVDNYYDYFPGSYTGKPMLRVETPTLNGNWVVFHAKATANANRRVYKAFIDNTGSILSNTTFGGSDVWEGYPGVALTEGGRPLLAYHVDLDDEATALEVGFGYDAVIGGVALGMHSDLYTIIDNPIDIDVNGTVVSTNEFIWPSVQVGPSPIEGSQRVYVMGKNATTNGDAVSENVVIFFKDFTESDIENQVFDGNGWSSTSIPTMDEWNTSTDGWRRPYMSFIVSGDKLYYIGYHIAYTEATDGDPLDEGTTTAFVGDNYGEGTWTRYSTYNKFDIENVRSIDPATGEIDQSTGIFVDDSEEPYADEFIQMAVGQSGHFSSSIDGEGNIHFPLFYTVESTTGGYWPDFHTVKQMTFNTNTNAWMLSEVYPQVDNGTNIPNDPINITNYDGANDGYFEGDLWKSWDKNADGLVDEVLDDGTWDGVDDGVTAADTDYWGLPIRDNIWPYMYWDSSAADDAMMFHLHTAHITDANEEGMMAMVWQDAQKSKDYNEYPDEYPELADYQNMCELAISVSADNGAHWSQPIFLNGVDNPEMQDEIPEFPYLGNKVDFVGTDDSGNKIGRVHVLYLDDDTYGSSVQAIGQATGGAMKYMALDVVFVDAPVDNEDNDVAPNIAMLTQNYPNPFNPTTQINYNVVKTGDVTLNVYNVKGQLVKTLVNAKQNVGMHNVVWNGDDNRGNTVSSGLYFYKVENAGRSEMKKMVLMK
jgi:hypothetical protein